MSAGGKSTRRRKASGRDALPRAKRRDPDAVDPSSKELVDVDWDALPSRAIELDPALVEEIRSRHRLKQLTLRVGAEQIETAREVARRTGAPYQSVLRRWLAEGASRERRRARGR